MRSLLALNFLGLSILVAACTKELKYSKEDLLKRAQAADASVTVVLPRSISEGVTCGSYSEAAGCLSAHVVSVRKLELIAVEFETEEQAKAAARKFRGWYTRNWLLDDVTGEPALEDFVSRHLEAKRP